MFFKKQDSLHHTQTEIVISMVLYLLYWNQQLEGIKFGGKHWLIFPNG